MIKGFESKHYKESLGELGMSNLEKKEINNHDNSSNFQVFESLPQRRQRTMPMPQETGLTFKLQ